MRTVLLPAIAAIALSSGAAAQTPPQRLAVPAFFPLQVNGAVNGDWTRTLQAGPVAKIVVADLGIGPGVPGTGCTSSPTALFDCLRANGQIVLGYVTTTSGTRPLDTVFDGSDNAPGVNGWFAAYGGHIDGIFLDEGPNAVQGSLAETTQRDYYTKLFSRLKGTAASFRADRCGGRACVMLNASQFAVDWVLAVSDYTVVWERSLHGLDQGLCPRRTADSQEYLDATRFCPADGSAPNPSCATQQSPKGWYFDPANVERIAHVIYSVRSAADIDRIIAQGRSRYGTPGFLYIHDQDCARYARLPPYFEQVVGALGSTDVVLPITRADGAVMYVPLAL